MFISPMLLQEAIAPPEDYANVITELKLDGIRLIYSNLGGEVKLYTRYNRDVTVYFPEVASVSLPKGVILDGELIAPDPENKPDYHLLLDRYHSKQVDTSIMIQFVAFDIIYYKGKKVTQLPLIERKKLLDLTVPTDNISIVTSQWVEGNSEMYFDIVREYNLEGIVVKKPHSKYQTGRRTDDWIKIINYRYLKEKKSGLNKSNCFLMMLNQNQISQKFLTIDMKPIKNRNKLYESYRQMINKIKIDLSH